jgi:hypothetical protein
MSVKKAKCSNSSQRFKSLYDMLETVTKNDRSCKNKAKMFDKIVKILSLEENPSSQISEIKKVILCSGDLNEQRC